MKTSSITKGAMCVAIYGLLLLLNQQTGLMIEASLSWVFIMPILLYSASQGVRAGLVTGISMGLLSFLFGFLYDLVLQLERSFDSDICMVSAFINNFVIAPTFFYAFSFLPQPILPWCIYGLLCSV